MTALSSIARRGWRHFMGDSLYRNSIFLMANTAVLSVTGFAYWAFAAHIFNPATIGIVTTLITASTFIASISFIGLDYALIRFIPQSPETASRQANTALNISAIATILVSAVYILLSSHFAKNLNFLHESIAWTALFITTMLFTTWNTLTNSVFIALRITKYILVASLFFGIARLPLVLAFSDSGAFGLFLAHGLALLVGVILSLFFLRSPGGHNYRPEISRMELRKMASFSLNTYVSNIVLSLPPLLVPIIILHTLGPQQVAYYYIPVLIMGLLNIIPIATSQSLFAEGSWNSSELTRHITKATKIIYILILPAAVLIISGSHFLLNFFGYGYSANGTTLLACLCIAGLFKAASYLLGTVLRIQGQVKTINVVTLTYAASYLTLSYIWLSRDKSLLALGLVTICCEALMAFICYAIYHRVKLHNT